MTSGWTQRQKLTASDAAGGDRFGAGVSILDDMAVVGSRTDDVTFDQQGSAYVFTRTETNWTQLTKLTAFDGGLNDHFGSSIALSGDSVLVGAVFFPYRSEVPLTLSPAAISTLRNAMTILRLISLRIRPTLIWRMTYATSIWARPEINAAFGRQ